jgi:hypothetical protein
LSSSSGASSLATLFTTSSCVDRGRRIPHGGSVMYDATFVSSAHVLNPI